MFEIVAFVLLVIIALAVCVLLAHSVKMRGELAEAFSVFSMSHANMLSRINTGVSDLKRAVGTPADEIAREKAELQAAQKALTDAIEKAQMLVVPNIPPAPPSVAAGTANAVASDAVPAGGATTASEAFGRPISDFKADPVTP